MAHIERRVRNGKVTYRARYRDPAGHEHAKVFARKTETQRFLTEIENRKLKGAWTDLALGRVRFREWLQEWLGTTTNLRRTTAVRDETSLRLYVLPRFGDLPLAQIGQRDVRAWVADLTARGLAPATVVKAYHLLGKVLAGAVDAGMIAQSPCRRVSLPKIEREEMRFLTPVEIARLADAIQPRYRALVLVGAYGGLRIGGARRPPTRACRPAARHRRGRRDHDRGSRQAPGRAAQDTRQPPHGGLPRAVVDALAEHLAPGGLPSDFVFTSPQGGPLRVAAFRYRLWRPATKKAGLEGLRIHDLRHTAVALWIAATASPKEVAVRAGHSSVSFTLDRYGHLYPESDASLRDRLDTFFTEGQAVEEGVVMALPARTPPHEPTG